MARRSTARVAALAQRCHQRAHQADAAARRRGASRAKPSRRQAQHLGARRGASSRSQSLSTWRIEAGRQRRGCRADGCGRAPASAAPAACSQATAAAASTSAQPPAACAWRAGLAGVADARRRGARRSRQRPGQEVAPAHAGLRTRRESAGRPTSSRHSASPCVSSTRWPTGAQQRRVGQRAARRMAASIASPTQEVAVADHEGHACAARAASRSTSTQRASKPARAASSPTQTSNRSPRMNTASAARARAGAPPRPRRCAACASREVQVGDEVDRPPGRGRGAVGGRRQRRRARRHARRVAPRQPTSTARDDRHVVQRHVGVAAACCRCAPSRSRRPRRCPATTGRTPHSPSPAPISALKFEEAVVDGVDEELRGRRVRRRGARHRQRVALVLQAVVGLVLDRRARWASASCRARSRRPAA